MLRKGPYTVIAPQPGNAAINVVGDTYLATAFWQCVSRIGRWSYGARHGII